MQGDFGTMVSPLEAEDPGALEHDAAPARRSG